MTEESLMKKEMPKLKIKRGALMSFDMNNLLQKLVNTPTSNKNASHINHIYKEAKRNEDELRALFKKEVVEIHAVKLENGKVDTTPEGGYKVDPAKQKKHDDAMNAFLDQDAFIEWSPIRPSHLSDIKVTAKEIGLLGELYDENEGPGLPPGHALSLA
jgi:hypothetical protein